MEKLEHLNYGRYRALLDTRARRIAESGRLKDQYAQKLLVRKKSGRFLITVKDCFQHTEHNDFEKLWKQSYVFCHCKAVREVCDLDCSWESKPRLLF